MNLSDLTDLSTKPTYKSTPIILEKISEPFNPFLSNISDCIEEASSGLYCDVKGDIWCLSKEALVYTQLINIVIISGILGLFGITSNVFNLIVFVRLGFRETINISLFALSVSDLGASIMLIWMTLCFNPLLLHSSVAIEFDGIYYYTGAFPRDIFMLITAFLTSFITIERYLCVVFPFKVKRFTTTKKVTSIVFAIYVTVLASMLHLYRIVYLDWWWDPKRDNFVITTHVQENYFEVEEEIRIIYTVYSFSCYLIVVTCTALLVLKLKQRSNWRQTVSGQKDMTSSSIRDQQIIKTVTFVAVIFIVSYFPGILLLFMMFYSTDVDICGKYHNLYVVVDSIYISVSAVNSSVNIFVYYNMMSKYKATFNALFSKSLQK